MLDPFTALSLASTVVQFVDFGSKLIKEGSELYHSAGGALTVNAELEKITVDLKQLTNKLETPPLPGTTSTENTKENEALRNLAGSCSKAAEELLEVLEDLKVKGTNRQWQSLRQALRTSHKKDKIRGIEKKLDKLQKMLNTRLIAMMSDQQSSVISLLRSLDEGNSSRMTQLKTEIIDVVQHTKQDKHDKHDISEEDSSKLMYSLASMAKEGKTSEVNRSVLSSLCFESMTVRHSTIAEAHASTCEWIFEDGNHESADIDPRPRTGFMKWLKSENGIYWICGKAGSGKSTLMKYLCEDHRTMKALKLWAGSDKLITASYFFWNAGVPMQKSQQGLLQSLLHEVLGKCQDLIPLVCAERLKRIEDFRYSHLEPWSRSDLFTAFQQLVQHELASTKFCFFVDGLDEYDGDHEDIIRILKNFANSACIKICTSSRPWNAFVVAFGQTLERKLLLEDLTREDIRRYVKDLLDEHEQFIHLKGINDCYGDLVREIVDKARGVFLWVFLVVRSLRKGLKEGDDISDLQRRLRLLPTDLETYFQHMLDSIEVCYQEQSAQIFLIAANASASLSVMTLSMLDVKATGFAEKAEIKPFSQYQIDALQLKTRTRINARCKDLLEVYAIPMYDRAPKLQVGFIHRTAKDFLRTKDINNVLRSRIADEFNPRIFLCEALLVQIKRMDLDDHDEKNYLLREFIHYAREIENLDSFSVAKLLDELDRVMAIHGVQSGCCWVEESDRPPVRINVRWGVVTSRESKVSFLDYTAQQRLHLYVAHKLDNQPGLLQRQFVASRQLYYICMDFSDVFLSESFEGVMVDMASLLLEHGALPNEQVFGKTFTAWTALLHALTFRFYYEKSIKENYTLVEKFLLHGADPNANIRYKGQKTTPFKVIPEIFPPTEAEHLRNLIAKRSRRGLLQWLGWS
ncbi:hypothetical protein MMC11_000792 [Xylographa trunciseda]|nr:hypothetical protein [Xylographa trunciseda]